MGNAFYLKWEPLVIEWLQEHIGGFGREFFGVCTAFGGELVLVAVMCGLYFIYDKEVAKYIARRFMIAGCGLSCIKNLVCRLRPYFVHPEVKCLKPVDAKADIYDIKAQGFSFPSGHSQGSAGVFGGLAAKIRKKRVTALVTPVILLVGISRFCLGVHYPTDVLAGWALGLGSIFLFTFMEKLISRRWIIYLIWLMILASGMFYCRTNDYYTYYGMTVGVFAADLFEERFVRFEKPRNILWGLARMAGAVLIFFAAGALFKLPFDPEFLSSGTKAAFLVRAVRYAVLLFLVMGLYPAVFGYIEKKKRPEGT